MVIITSYKLLNLPDSLEQRETKWWRNLSPKVVRSIDVSRRQMHKRDKPFPQDGPREKGKGGRQVLLGSAFPLKQKTGKAGATKPFWCQMGGAGSAWEL